MAIYRFKFSFEDDEEIVRVIDIRSNQTLEDLHFAFLTSLEFDSKHNAIFYLSNDHWKKGQKYILLPDTRHEDGMHFAAAKLSSLINDPHQKLLYIYDLAHEWSFMVELVGIIIKEDTTKTYPFCSKKEGKAPKQYSAQGKVAPPTEEEEFDYLTKSLLSGEIAEDMTDHHVDSEDAESLEGEEGEELEGEDDEDLHDDDEESMDDPSMDFASDPHDDF